MGRRDDERRERRRHEFATVLWPFDGASQQRLSGGRTEAHDDLRPQDPEFGLEPWPASANLSGIRFRMDAPLASGLPFEVFDDIGDVRATPVYAGTLESLGENTSRRGSR